MAETPGLPSRWVWMAFLLSIAAGVFMARQLLGPPPDTVVEDSGRMPVAPVPPDVPVAPYTSRFETELNARLPHRQPSGGTGLVGLLREGAASPGEGAGGPPAGAGPGQASPAEQASARGRELAFIRQHDSELRRYQSRLNKMTARYHKRFAVVREVDADFGRLKRYMALNRQYAQDRDGYKWARSVVALPEVRAAVWKHAKRPEVWSVGFQMISEAMKDPPPKPIYEEMKRFVSADPAVSDYIGQFASDIMPYLGKMATQAVSLGIDLSPMIALAQDVTPGQAKAAAVPAARGRSPQRK